MDQFGNVVDQKAFNKIKQTKDESLKIKKDDWSEMFTSIFMSKFISIQFISIQI